MKASKPPRAAHKVAAPQALPVNAHRLARLMQWTQAVLLRAAYYLASAGSVWAPLERRVEEGVRPFLAKMTRAVFILIAAQAFMRMKRRVAVKCRVPQLEKPRSKRKLDRALFGVRLRHLAKASDPRAKIVALLNILNDIDAHAARLAKRLKNGLTRRRGRLTRASLRGAALVNFAFAPLVCADTS